MPTRPTVFPSKHRFFQSDGIGLLWQVIVFICVIAALFTRRPGLFLHAQFYAEDGRDWYAQAYNQGWFHALRLPQAGYLQTLPRLFTGIVLLLPFRNAPVAMNIIGIVLQALPVTALLSARCRGWGSLPSRMLMAAIYVAIPNTAEVHVVLTNAQWHIAVLILLLGLSEAPRSSLGRIGDVVLFAVGAVSGPFPLFICVLLWVYWWNCRHSWSVVLSSIFTAGAAVQWYTIHHAPHTPPGPLGARASLLIRILSGDVILGGLFGPGRYGYAWKPLPLLVVFLIGASIVGYIAARGLLPQRLFLLFTAVTLAAELHSPFRLSTAIPLWTVFLHAQEFRYWYYPILALLWSLAWCAFQARPRLLRVAAASMLSLMVIGAVRDWKYRPLPDTHFQLSAREFEQAPAGATVLIPGDSEIWSFRLVKKGERAQ